MGGCVRYGPAIAAAINVRGEVYPVYAVIGAVIEVIIAVGGLGPGNGLISGSYLPLLAAHGRGNNQGGLNGKKVADAVGAAVIGIGYAYPYNVAGGVGNRPGKAARIGARGCIKTGNGRPVTRAVEIVIYVKLLLCRCAAEGPGYGFLRTNLPYFAACRRGYGNGLSLG